MIYIKVFFAIVFWGMSFAFTKKALGEVSIPTLLFVRAILGALTVLLFLCELSWIKTLTKKDWLKMIFLAFTGVIIQQGLQAYSLLNTSSNHAGWLISLIPIAVVFVLVVVFKETIAKAKWLGFVMGFVGVSLVFFSKQTLVGGEVVPTMKGDIIFSLTAINWAFYVIYLARWFREINHLRVIFIFMTLSAVMVRPFFIMGDTYQEFNTIMSENWKSLIYLGVFCSGFSFIFYNQAVSAIGAARASSFMYLQPFVAIFTGYFLLGEEIAVMSAVGGLIILIGLYYINGGRKGLRFFARIHEKMLNWYPRY